MNTIHPIQWTVEAEEAGNRLDRYLAETLDVSRSSVQQWIAEGAVTVNGQPAAKQYKLREQDLIEVVVPQPVPLEIQPEPIPLDILYEDDHLLVINKPKGMVVHPAAGHYEGTLVNALLAHCGDSLSGINGVLRPGIVHRLDKDTSGLLVVAKNDAAHQGLAAQMQEHQVTRCYEAVVCGRLREEAGTVNAPIGRHPVDRKKMAVNFKNGKPAITHYQVLEEFPGTSSQPAYSHLQLRLQTGRTHQIRVHMAYLGHPVAGDGVYGSSKGLEFLQGQCLHARTIGFTHPTTGEQMEFTTPLPDYFAAFLATLQKNC